MNAGLSIVAVAPPDQLDPQQSWVPWLIILAVVAALVVVFAVRGRSKAARRGASAIGGAVAGLDAMLRPSRKHVLEAKSKQRKRDEGQGGPDEAGDRDP